MVLRFVFVFLIGLGFAGNGFCQSPGSVDSIRIAGSPFFGMKFYQGNEKVSMRKLVTIMNSDPVALTYLNKARSNNTIATIFGFIGGALIGYELGGALSGKKVNGAVMGAGAGCIVVAVPFSISGGRNSKKAVHAYNAIYR